MSPSRTREPRSHEVRLKVRAGSPLAEVFLIDDAFALVDRSVGDLDVEVPPGVYKVKSKLGDATVERLVVLDADQTLDVSSDLVVRSPVPLGEATRDRRRGIDYGRGRSEQMSSAAGDAEVFLMTRSGIASDDLRTDAPQVSLHRLDGTLIELPEPRSGGSRDEQFTTVEVDPGPYLVRRRDRFDDVGEQCVYAVAGWQTQVFTLEEPGDEADIGRIRVSVLMSRHGFDPSDPQLHLVEEARTALADERKVASYALGELCEKVEDPMLALFGAHLMLVARDNTEREDEKRASGRLDEEAVTAPVTFDQERFDRVVDRLAEMLGPGHPDVIALATERSGQPLELLPPIGAPPMLWRSWVLLIAASNTLATLVPVSTWQRTLHVLPLRPFFLWSPTEESTPTRESFTRSIATSLSGQAPTTRGGGRRQRSLSTGEPGVRTPSSAVRRRVSENLLVPRAAIDIIASGEPL
jgi:hypothetical protein